METSAHARVPPATELRSCGPAERATLRRLVELYAYDFSEVTGTGVGEDGCFVTDAWFEEHLLTAHRLFLIRADGRLAGFAAVDDRSQISGDPDVYDMLQFFILRGCRSLGVGAAAARTLFDAFPGDWEVRSIAENARAQRFWRRIVGDYSGGRFEEDWWSDPVGSGVVHRFHVPPMSDIGE